MKKRWIIANWKSNKTISEALAWIEVVGPKLPRQKNLKVVVCPNFTNLEEAKKAVLVGNYPLIVGSQDLSPFEDGPYTGEESARILTEIVDLAILGHAERRKNFGETDGMVTEKVKRAKEYNIIPLVCVQSAETAVPEGVNLVAYEPVFAIGTDHPDTPDNAVMVAGKIKQLHGQGLEVLYGGDVNPQNAKSFLQGEELSGLLIGRASLEAEEFLQIIEIAKYE